MQSVSSRIWTRVAVSISYDDNHYITGTCTSWYLSEAFCPKISVKVRVKLRTTQTIQMGWMGPMVMTKVWQRRSLILIILKEKKTPEFFREIKTMIDNDPS